MLNLETDIININRVGAATAKKLKKIGLATVQDLLFYFPFRYDDFRKITLIKDLVAGQSASVVGQVELVQNKRSARRRLYLTEALINDGSETLKVIWFNQPFLARAIKVGDKLSLAGKLDDNYGSLTMVSPIYEKIADHSIAGAVHTQGLVPNYHLTANLTQKQVRFLIKQIIPLADRVKDWLPAAVKQAAGLIDLNQAIKKIHFPQSDLAIKKARERLAFNELFLIQLQAQLIKQNLNLSQAPAIEFYEEATRAFVDSLPFKLTNAQKKSAWEILRDLAKTKPMSRLLQGDVGSGKTLVALIAMLNVALNHKQAVLLVPTEILARQHYDNICGLLAGNDIKVGLVTRSQKILNYELRIMNNEKKAKSKDHDSGLIIHDSDIVIGTHALLQENIEFRDLALAIIDEQHRFGVEQRRALKTKTGHRQKNYLPHLLSLTATPIPRSLALALFGDLDLSVIGELPENRKKIITRVVPEDKRAAAYNFIRQQVGSGRQVFVICPLIDLSDKLGVKSVEAEYKKLAKTVFPDLVIGKLHGRLKAGEKEKIMKEFLAKKIAILVATSVVEVGVDVPNASVMMIEGADRFGLAQLHQFRGRVGRSQHQSYCFLFASAQFSESGEPDGFRTAKARQRLEALEKNHDGLTLAKIDLKLRGPGEVYGLEQKGFPELKVASLFDYALMKLAHEQAKKIIALSPELRPWPDLKAKIGENEKQTHLE